VKIQESLVALLNNPSFLPDGGLVGFGLSHLYPIGSNQKFKISLDELGESLKGTDAAIKRACDSLCLDVSVKMVYQSNETKGIACLLNQIGNPGYDKVDDVIMHLKEESKGPALIVYDSDKLSLKDVEEDYEIIPAPT
jgi:predicted nucleic acid-binding protein